MNIFQGNQKLEEAIFTGLDYALWSRHDLDDAFTPFMMLYKNGNSKLVRIAADGNPIEYFESTLKDDGNEYDQIIMCLEGRVPHDGVKQDAIIVKGFDTSHEHGLVFVQRFRGKESGKGFMKLGNPALVDNKEALPVPLVERATHKTVEEPYISGIILNEETGEISREIIAGHENSSILANHLFDRVLSILDINEINFSGKFNINFVPNTIKLGEFTDFIFTQLISDIKNNPSVKDWEISHGKSLSIELKYNEGENTKEKTPKSIESTIPEQSKYQSSSTEELHEEYQRIISIPNARTNISALTDMTELMAEYENRGLEMPNSMNTPNPMPRRNDKPWWKFW